MLHSKTWECFCHLASLIMCFWRNNNNKLKHIMFSPLCLILQVQFYNSERNSRAQRYVRETTGILASMWCCAVLRRSVLSASLWPHGLQPARLLCPWGFSRQEHWSGLPCPPPEGLPKPGIEPRSTSLQADSLQSDPPRKIKIGHREGTEPASLTCSLLVWLIFACQKHVSLKLRVGGI